ncbi:unnamed protein product, partial [Mesorhabditis spiculigera]
MLFSTIRGTAEPFRSMPHESAWVSVAYVTLGFFGFVCNCLVVAMILSVSAYRKSAYLLMANIAVADAVQSLIVGCYTGYVLVAHAITQQHTQLFGATANSTIINEDEAAVKNQLVCVLTITAWFVMIYTYAVLGINRCVSTCFYKTKLRKFNRLRCTQYMIVGVWAISIIGGVAASFPEPIIVVQIHIWTMRFINFNARSQAFILFNIIVNAASICLQWVCSIFVLSTVRTISKRISNHAISSAKIRRSQKQVRLSFQFFYPSVVCTLSSIMFFSMPLYAHLMTRWHFLISHLVWLANHLCNPLIYAYFNGRMRETLALWLRCERDNGNSIAEKGKNITTFGQSCMTEGRKSTKDQTTTLLNSSAVKKFSLPSLRIHHVPRAPRGSQPSCDMAVCTAPLPIVEEVQEAGRKLTF